MAPKPIAEAGAESDSGRLVVAVAGESVPSMGERHSDSSEARLAGRLSDHAKGGVRSVVLITQCDPFGIPSTSHWTGAATIVLALA